MDHHGRIENVKLFNVDPTPYIKEAKQREEDLAKAEKDAEKARKLAELTDAHWVLIGPRDGPGNEFGRAFHQHDLTPPNVRTLSESYFGALALIESLDAVCNFPERLLGGRFDNWRVRKIDIREKMRPMEIAMTVRSGLPLTPAADHLANCIRRRCSSLSAPTR